MTRLLLSAALFIVIGPVAGRCQDQKDIDWKPCTDITDKLKDQATKFNTEHVKTDGLQMVVECEYMGDPNRKQLPKIQVSLTPTELVRWRAIRKAEDEIFKATEDYETYLIRMHHVHKPRVGDPCFYFVGIVLGQDYITVDPNPMEATAGVQCDQLISKETKR